MQCHKCGVPGYTPGVVLTRVNPKGEKGIFQCDPDCKVTHLSNKAALTRALDMILKEQTKNT